MAHEQTVVDVGGSSWTFTMPDQVNLTQATSSLRLDGVSSNPPLVIDIALTPDLLFNAAYHGIISIEMKELVPLSPNSGDILGGLRGSIQIVLRNQLGIPVLNPPSGDTMALYVAGVSDQFPTAPPAQDSFHTFYTHFHAIQVSGATPTFPGFAVTPQVGPFPGAYPGSAASAPNWLQLDGTLAPGTTLTTAPFTFHRRDTTVADDASLNLIFFAGAFDPAALAQLRQQWELDHGIVRPDGTLAIGGALADTIESGGDKDLFAVTLTAGQTYAFDLTGLNGGGGTLADPYLRLLDATGRPILLNGVPVENDDYAGKRDSHIHYTASVSGIHYLDVRAFNAGQTGTYTLAAPPARIGTTGPDLITDTPGRQFYDGAAGHDTFILPSAGRRGTVFTQAGTSELVLAHDGQTDTLLGIEEVRFIDGRMVFDATDPAAAVTRLYQAGLGRAPDQSGLNFWIGAVGRGTPLAELATGFLTSPEFTARYGTGLTNQAFVTRIYQNVLGRDPEASGLAFWTGGLDQGIATRGDTLAGISESGENKSGTAALVGVGIWDRSEAAQSVARLYDTALGRLPDVGGLSFWTQAIDTGAGTLTDLARLFVTSAEFVATYGALANRAFVEKVYSNTLGRAGDAEGVDFWTRHLDSGLSRAEVTVGFSESLEHQERIIANTGGEAPGTYGIKLT